MKNDKILLNHGSGGKLTHELISSLFVKYFNNEVLASQTDSAILDIKANTQAFTTDSYVVDPVFFPGGNIGKLAVCGTVNDLSVSGATPKYLSCGFIIEEGMLISELEEIVSTMAEEALKAGVIIVTGDTKVVDKGKCDKIFINTSGIGILKDEQVGISLGKGLQAGNAIIVNGFIGDHAASILCARNKLEYTSDVISDCAALNMLIGKICKTSAKIMFMRDATRGGLATVLCEVAEKHKLGIELIEEKIPVREKVKGLCEMFGFDPLYMANEGKVVVVCAEEDAKRIVDTMHQDELGKDAAVIGYITDQHKGTVVIKTSVGGSRIVDMLAGEQLPRIC